MVLCLILRRMYCTSARVTCRSGGSTLNRQLWRRRSPTAAGLHCWPRSKRTWSGRCASGTARCWCTAPWAAARVASSARWRATPSTGSRRVAPSPGSFASRAQPRAPPTASSCCATCANTWASFSVSTCANIPLYSSGLHRLVLSRVSVAAVLSLNSGLMRFAVTLKPNTYLRLISHFQGVFDLLV